MSTHGSENYLAAIDSLLNQIIQQGGFALSFAIHPVLQESSDLESPEYVADFTGADADLLLERNGALLDALEHVVLEGGAIAGRAPWDNRLRLQRLAATAYGRTKTHGASRRRTGAGERRSLCLEPHDPAGEAHHSSGAERIAEGPSPACREKSTKESSGHHGGIECHERSACPKSPPKHHPHSTGGEND